MLHLIYNPTAGRGRAPAALEQALGLLTASGAEYQLHTTQGVGHGTALAAATPPGATVVAVGGDGTVHEVVRGLVRAGLDQGRVLGVLPVGSGDDFAYANGIDRKDMAAAVGKVLNGSRRAVDLGFIDGEPFVNALGVGFDAEVGHRLTLAPGFLKGLGAYLYAVFASLGSLDPSPVRVEIDGREVYTGRSLLVATQIGPRTGGSFMFAPGARNDDALFDVVIAGDCGLWATLGLLPKVMRGRHIGHPKVFIHRGAEVKLSWERPQHGHMEGEPVGLRSEHHAVIRPGALSVLG